MIDTSISSRNELLLLSSRTGIAAMTLGALLALSLFGCTHEPEIATPPTEDVQQTQSASSQSKAASSADAGKDGQAGDDATDSGVDPAANEENDGVAESAAVHEGPYIVSILNAGGADGLAGRAQETLASNGIGGDGYTISVDSYLGGTIERTTVYVTGVGDDAEAVKAEAEKIAESLGGEVKTYTDGELVEGITMDGLDILVLVGANAV